MKDIDWLPDWRNPSEYPSPDDLSRYEWMWEFLRRNPRYQEICDKKWAEYSKFIVSGNKVTIVEAPKILHEEFEFHYSSSFPHYSSNNGDESAVSGRYESSAPIRFINEFPMIWSPTDDNLEKMDLYNFFKRKLKENKVFLSVDLTASIETQLKEISRRLTSIQKDRGLGTKRSHTTKFPLYIRILDALAKGEKNSIIRDKLFPEKEHIYPDSPRKDRYNYSKKAAIRFRDHDFKLIMINNYQHPETDQPNKI